MSAPFRLSKAAIFKIGIVAATALRRPADCDAAAMTQLPVIAQPARDFRCSATKPNQTQPAAVSDCIGQRVRDAGTMCWKLLKSVYRAMQLMLVFAPAAITSPLLLTSSEDLHLVWWSILKRSIKTSGPCFTKLAQWVATRPDLFPGCICQELETLQVSAVTHSWADTERALVAALGPEGLKRVTINDRTKLTGSGSAAQVYCGLFDNERVAIKVLHPGIRDAMNADLDILGIVTSVAELLPGVASMSLHEGMEEFRSLLLQQLNLRTEAEALLQFRRNFSSPEWKKEVNFPNPMMEVTSEEVLFETFEDGVSISHYLTSDRRTRNKLANLCLDLLLKMVQKCMRFRFIFLIDSCLSGL